MENYYIISLQFIKYLNLETEEEYRNIVKDYIALSLESVKYISQTRDFEEIRKIAEEIV